jgi:hypothetical protein
LPALCKFPRDSSESIDFTGIRGNFFVEKKVFLICRFYLRFDST